jgi:hypothetical protein
MRTLPLIFPPSITAIDFVVMFPMIVDVPCTSNRSRAHIAAHLTLPSDENLPARAHRAFDLAFDADHTIGVDVAVDRGAGGDDRERGAGGERPGAILIRC